MKYYEIKKTPTRWLLAGDVKDPQINLLAILPFAALLVYALLGWAW